MNNIEVFLKASTFAVAGASQDRSKYGNKVFRALVASGRNVYPLNPTATKVEGYPAFASITELPVVPESLSIVTPPHVTREFIQQAITAGVKNVWMQPGAEDDQACQAAREAVSTLSTTEAVYLCYLPARIGVRHLRNSSTKMSLRSCDCHTQSYTNGSHRMASSCRSWRE